jgi:hypothetical protein
MRRRIVLIIRNADSREKFRKIQARRRTLTPSRGKVSALLLRFRSVQVLLVQAVVPVINGLGRQGEACALALPPGADNCRSMILVKSASDCAPLKNSPLIKKVGVALTPA